MRRGGCRRDYRATALAHAFGWVSSARWDGIALLGLGVGISPLVALVSVGLRCWGWVVDPLPWYMWCGWGLCPPLVPLVSVELRSWGWGLASLSSLHSLAWDCALGVGGLGGWPPPLGLGSGLATVYINKLSA